MSGSPATRAGSGGSLPKTVVAALGDNDRWECAQNPRAAFNACDIPEEAWEGDGK